MDGSAIIQPPTMTDDHEIWHRLQTRFMQASLARSMELKTRLNLIKKTDSQSMDAYLREIKILADSLAAIQCSVFEPDLVHHTLLGLNRCRDYDHLVTTLTHYPMPLTFDEIRPKLLLQEQWIKIYHDEGEVSSSMALAATHAPPAASNNKQQGGASSGRNNRGRNNKNKGKNSTASLQNGISNFNLSTLNLSLTNCVTNVLSATSNNSSSGILGSTPSYDTFGLCWNWGHQAAYCPHRFNPNFVPHHESVNRAFAALSVGGDGNDSVWYPESGAASHMTLQDGQDNRGGNSQRNQS